MIVPLSIYAEKHGRTSSTLRALARQGRFSTARKTGRVWMVDIEEAYPAKKRATLPELRVLSLFSGCGGLDLGFEGHFPVPEASLNEIIHPDWVSAADRDSTDTNLHSADSINTTKTLWKHLQKTRFTTVFTNDIREETKAAWLHYFSRLGKQPSLYRTESIVDLVKAHLDGEPVFPQNIDVVTGGFPCQDFSVAGKRLGFRSDKSHDGSLQQMEAPSVENRGQLYMWMREVIGITQPKVFVAENVKGLVNLADVKSIIENDFRSIGGDGYLVVDARILHAADYGVPQSRERVIFIGFRKTALNPKALHALSASPIEGLYDPYPPRTHAFTSSGRDLFDDSDTRLMPPATIRQVLCDLPEPDASDDIAQQKYSKAKFMGKHCQGQTEIRLDSIAPTIRSEHHGNIEFRRLSQEHGGTQLEELDRGLQERRLTVRECARLQTFPDDFDFILPADGEHKSVSASAAYKMIGNATPPLLAYHLAKRLEKNWQLYFGGATE